MTLVNFEEIIAKLPKPYYRDNQSDIVIYCGDCREILPLISGKSIDLVLTDPPYGIGGDKTIHCTKPSRPNTYLMQKKYVDGDWDIKVDNETIMMLLDASTNQVIWGGNYYSSLLPESRCWLYWDKMFENTNNFSHGELAWTSFLFGIKQIRISSKSETRGGRDRVHPTQKPVKLMEWCIDVSNQAMIHNTILDPFMGSGTVMLAAKHLNRHCIGIEIEEKYCEIAAKRLSQSVMRLE